MTKKRKRRNLLIHNKAPKSPLQTLRINFEGTVRNDQMEGRDYLVAPMVMMVEGVLNGSAGPLYYPAEELEKTPMVWNHKPVVVYHPKMNGVGISACDPDVLTSQKVGVIMNARCEDGKLKADAWIEKDRAATVDDRILTALESETTMELSTGLFTDNEDCSGEFDGKAYDQIARNYRPDHLALLPDQLGACSIEAGAGFIRLNQEQIKTLSAEAKSAYQDFLKIAANELSHDQIWSELNGAIQKLKGDRVWIDEVFNTFFIYRDGDQLFRLKYIQADNDVEIVGDPEEVVRVTEFRTLDGTVIGNKEIDMKKEEMVAAIIANSAWTEDDKDYLMGQDEKHLEKMMPVANKEDDLEKPDGKAVTPATGEDTTPVTPVVPEANSVEAFVASAPEGMRGMLNSAMAAHNVQKTQAVEAILGNALNTFTKEHLMTKDLEELQGMAQLAGATPAQPVGPIKPPMFVGQGDVVTDNAGAAGEEEALEMAVINFDADQK